MRLGGPANKKTNLTVRLILGGLALIFIIAFWGEIKGVFSLVGTFFMMILGFSIENIDKSIRQGVPIICFNCFFGFGLVFVLWLFLISAQALLPVNNLQEVYRTAWHLWLFITHQHGPAVFVKDGVKVSTHEDEKVTVTALWWSISTARSFWKNAMLPQVLPGWRQFLSSAS